MLTIIPGSVSEYRAVPRVPVGVAVPDPETMRFTLFTDISMAISTKFEEPSQRDIFLEPKILSRLENYVFRARLL